LFRVLDQLLPYFLRRWFRKLTVRAIDIGQAGPKA
jgi:hypothetical protein